MKHRACYNCVHYEERGIGQLPMGSRPTDLSGAITTATDPRYTSFAPRCLKGLNPSLAHAPKFMGERIQNGFEPDAMAAFCDTYLWAPPDTGDKFRTMVRRNIEQDSRFTTVDLPHKFIRFWEKGHNVRIKIEREGAYRYSECGYVAISTGWEPVFVLCRSIKSKGSSVVLRDEDNIVGIRDWNSKGYKVYRVLA